MLERDKEKVVLDMHPSISKLEVKREEKLLDLVLATSVLSNEVYLTMSEGEINLK